MAFSFEHWQSQVRAWWTEHDPRVKATLIKSTYTLLAISIWLSLLAHYGRIQIYSTLALTGAKIIMTCAS